jgi:hypothetical protein
MTECKNPECRNGLVPGLRVAGNGTYDGAKPGARMQWCAVPCPACRPQPKGPGYVPVNRGEDEIADRWELATRRAPYVDKPKSPAPQAAVSSAPRVPSATETEITGNAVAERIATALEKIATRMELLTGAVLELCEKEANPLMTVTSEAHIDDENQLVTRKDLGKLLRQLLESARIASHECVKEAKAAEPTPTGAEKTAAVSRSSRAKTKGASARRRGGTVGGLAG